MKSALGRLPLLGLLLLTAAGDPAPDIVAQRGDVRMTTAELRELVANADPVLRSQLQSSSAALADFVRQRLLSTTLLNEARAKGWEQRPDVLQRANDARDAVILQSYVASLIPPDPAFPSDAEVATAYEANKARLTLPRQYHLAQIVLMVPANAQQDWDDAQRRKVAELRALAVKPKADFADLARKNSQDTTSAGKGGDVGWVREDQLLPMVREAVARLPENGVSEPVRAPDGWHVLRLLETRAPGAMSLEDAKPQLVQALRQARGQQAVRAYVDAMLRKDPIQLNEIDLTKQLAPPR